MLSLWCWEDNGGMELLLWLPQGIMCNLEMINYIYRILNPAYIAKMVVLNFPSLKCYQCGHRPIYGVGKDNRFEIVICFTVQLINKSMNLIINNKYY